MEYWAVHEMISMDAWVLHLMTLKATTLDNGVLKTTEFIILDYSQPSATPPTCLDV